MRGHPYEYFTEPNLPVCWDKDFISTPLGFLTMAGANLHIIKQVYELHPDTISKSLLCEDDTDGDTTIEYHFDSGLHLWWFGDVPLSGGCSNIGE